MAGYFYAWQTKAKARQSRPDWFVQDEDGNWYVHGQRIEYATAGLPLTAPVMAEDGETVETPSEMSEAYVILSPDADGPAGKLITPYNHLGFAEGA
jgi:hypothetical protein